MIAFGIAFPVAIWILNQWLQTFAYHDEFNIFLIGAGCALSLIVALLTVGYRAWIAATSNPAKSLRTE